MHRLSATVLAASIAVGFAPAAARAVTLDDAIAQALAHDPGLKRARAEQDAADARVTQARALGLPSVTLTAGVASGSTDFGDFFGFGRENMTPRSAQVTLQQPIFAGGGIRAAIDQAKALDRASRSSTDSVRLTLIADVADAYVGVLTSRQALELGQAQIEELTLAATQAQQQFESGEVARTAVDQAKAALAEARARYARSQGAFAVAAAHYRMLVGDEPLTGGGRCAAGGASADGGRDRGRRGRHPAIAAAEAQVSAAKDGIRRAEADRYPTVAIQAQASSIRDQFLPGYRADGFSVGVQGSWTVFSGGALPARSRRREPTRAAEAALDQARAAVDEGVIDAWTARQSAEAAAAASSDQVKAADAALADVREEVSVGERPTLDLLDAERADLDARIASLDADAARVVAAYRLETPRWAARRECPLRVVGRPAPGPKRRPSGCLLCARSGHWRNTRKRTFPVSAKGKADMAISELCRRSPALRQPRRRPPV